MNVGLRGVPVIDRHPIELCAQVAFCLGHQAPRESLQISKLGGILRHDDEAEMMPIFSTMLSKVACVCIISG